MAKFTGNDMTAPFSGKKCVYFETALFYDVGTSTGHYHTQEKFIVELNGKKTEISVPPARLYLEPSFEKEFDPKKAPKKFKEIFDNIFGNEVPDKVIVKEWALEIGKEYLVEQTQETFYLPPLPGEKEPGEARYTAYTIKDKEYSYEEKERKKTPASYWTG